MKHTPGLWTLKEANTTIPIVGANGRTVATVRYLDNDYSDACLIAAAPELLAALDLAEATIERLNRHNSANGALHVVRAAIHKATEG